MWHLTGSSLSEVRERINRKYAKDDRNRPDGIYMMHAHDEESFLVYGSGEFCDKCGREGTEDNPVFWSEDPFASEINDDHTEMNICKDCHHESLMDI